MSPRPSRSGRRRAEEGRTTMNPSLIFLLAGMLGAALRSLVASDQWTLSRKSVVDVVVGGLAGVLYPRFPLIGFPDGSTIWEQGAMIALLGYFGASVVQNILARIPAAQEKLTTP